MRKFEQNVEFIIVFLWYKKYRIYNLKKIFVGAVGSGTAPKNVFVGAAGSGTAPTNDT